MRRLVALAAVLLAFLVTVGAAHAQTPFRLINQLVPPGLSNAPRQALRSEQLTDNHLRLTGDVEIHRDAWELYADQVDIFTDESRLVATGNVVFTSADGRIAAERVEFDLETETGTFYNVSVKGGPANP